LTATLTEPVLPGYAPAGHVRLDAGPADVHALNRMVADGARAGSELAADAGRLDEVIPKPWGHELRAFADEYFDVWALHIGPGHATSMHVHPRKLTYLICLAGTGLITGLGSEVMAGAGTIVRIAAGAFHSTRNTGGEPLRLVEVEVPRNKLDLLRLRDGYRREGTGYETQSRALPQLPMRQVRHRPNTRMRDQTPDGLFRFEVRAGMDIFYRRLPADICYVPLCMSGVIGDDVEILCAAGGRAPDVTRTYLCIARAA
jgi:mannose-6-phosphate isomerase-like protein (cupin superfamily)